MLCNKSFGANKAVPRDGAAAPVSVPFDPAMSQPRFAAIILAAGSGTRMNSALPKVMHPIAGQPMIAYLLQAVQPLAPGAIVVVPVVPLKWIAAFPPRAMMPTMTLLLSRLNWLSRLQNAGSTRPTPIIVAINTTATTVSGRRTSDTNTATSIVSARC